MKNKSAFTLIELLTVIAILGILFGIFCAIVKSSVGSGHHQSSEIHPAPAQVDHSF